MDQCEDREDRVLPSKMSLIGEHEDQRKLSEPEPEPGPGPSCVSLSSNNSKSRSRAAEPSCVSWRSNKSKDVIILFKSDQPPAAKRKRLKNDDQLESKLEHLSSDYQRVDQQSSEVPTGPSVQLHQTQLDSIFMLLEENIVTFVKNELKNIQKVLSPDDPGSSEGQSEDEEVMGGEDEEQRRSSREAVMKITLNFLRKMKQEELAECLQSS
ncbi:uncharacterized protein LOC116715699 isoform X3 [Xiphophorus hellerii]|uniref:uncharacterized protein LOC116715699 isoform X3 n=1 Tax=Xiphophorus hellerii TaxID=8084 RepID=UPI0013B36E48|nr:uncharacterized protein LOC116715699 isoform X3 [Xiphophorus hellerii]